MNPLRLRAENLRTFPSVDLEIPEGITAVVGSNGAGKSTLLEAIELALFADGARDLAPALGPFAEHLEIQLDFEHDGSTYRVRRRYSAKRTQFDLERWDDLILRDWESITRENAKSTQTYLEQLLGLNRATFNASAFLAQGNSAAFCEAAPSERRDILGAILDARGLWPKLAERASDERKLLEFSLNELHVKIEEREGLVSEIPVLHREHDRAKIAKTVADDANAEALRKLSSAESAIAQNEAAASATKTAEQLVLNAAAEKSRIVGELTIADAERKEIEPSRAKLAALELQTSQIDALGRELRSLGEAEIERQRLDAAKALAEESAMSKNREWHRLEGDVATLQDQYDNLTTQIDALENHEVETCALCQQELGAAARVASISALQLQKQAISSEMFETNALRTVAQSEFEDADSAARAIVVPDAPYDSRVSHIETKLETARAASQEHAGLSVRLSAYEEASARIPALTESRAQAERKLFDAEARLEIVRASQVDPDVLERKRLEAKADADDRREELSRAIAYETRAATELERATTAATELAEFANAGAELQTRLTTLRLAERACSRDGIPALIAENSVATIESEANRVLERMPTSSGSIFRLELRTQKALKSDASALRETLDILVSDRTTQREFATFSGGERFRVAFALRWSLARLLANRRGAESRLLVVDEPDGLDAGGMDGLASVMRDSASSFDRILVVSHNPLLAEQFEQVLSVTSDGEISRVELLP